MEVRDSYNSKDFSDEQIKYEIERLNQSVKAQENILKMCISLLNFQGNKALLDIGCGTGLISELIFRSNVDGRVVGIDREEKYINYAMKQFHQASKLEYCVSDCNFIAFPDCYFDICFSRFLFQHLQEPDRTVNELKRVMKPGGLIGIYDINKRMDVSNPEPDYAKEYKKAERVLKKIIQNDIYVGEKLQSILEKNGFVNVRIYDVSSNTNNTSRKELAEMVRQWEMEVSKKHPYIKSGIISYENMVHYLEDFQKIILDQNSFVNFGCVFAIGQLPKERE